jgi:hypothetical protein
LQAGLSFNKQQESLMKRGQLILPMLTCMLLLAGCGDSGTVEEMIKARKEGDAARARDIALASLSESSDRMDVWCQLTHTNLDAVRYASFAEDPFPIVAQSSLMCAALEKYKGKLSENWQAAKVIARGQIIAKARETLDRIDDSHREAQEVFDVKLSEGYFDKFPKEQRDRMIDDYQINLMKTTPQPLVDPKVAREIVWKAGCYAELLTLLDEGEREDVKITKEFIDKTLSEWPTYSELDPSFITDVRAEAAAELTRAYDSILNDLEQSGHFSVENVLHMDILP